MPYKHINIYCAQWKKTGELAPILYTDSIQTYWEENNNVRFAVRVVLADYDVKSWHMNMIDILTVQEYVVKGGNMDILLLACHDIKNRNNLNTDYIPYQLTYEECILHKKL